VIKNEREEFERIKALVALEEERGPFPPNGAGGGAGASLRRPKLSAALRSRERVRSQFLVKG
jgi:hypothetical protein